MGEAQSNLPLIFMAVFNISAFALVWWELKRQETRRHDQINRVSTQMAGLVLVSMDHAERLARMEGLPFSPAALFEKMDLETADADTQRLMMEIQEYLLRGKMKDRDQLRGHRGSK